MVGICIGTGSMEVDGECAWLAASLDVGRVALHRLVPSELGALPNSRSKAAVEMFPLPAVACAPAAGGHFHAPNSQRRRRTRRTTSSEESIGRPTDQAHKQPSGHTGGLELWMSAGFDTV